MEFTTSPALLRGGMRNPAREFVSQLTAGSPTEVGVVVVFVLYLLAYVWFGVKRRSEKREFLLASLERELQLQFARVEEAAGDGPNELVVYATGRQHCQSLTATLALPYTYDLLYLVSKVSPSERLTVRIDFGEQDQVLPVVFAVVRKSLVDQFLVDNDDVRIFGREESALGAGLVSKTESNACNPLPPHVLQVLLDNEPVIHSLLISDQIDLKRLDVAERAIVLHCDLPESAHRLQALVLALCDLVDHIHQVGLELFPTRQARQSAVESRSRIKALKKMQ